MRLLRSEELRIEDEYQVFTAAMDWVLQDMAKRKKNVVEVLEPVRFPLLSPQRLFKYIEGKKVGFFLMCFSISPMYLYSAFNNSKNISEILTVPVVLFSPHKGITDFSLRVALQTLLREYTEVTKSPKENKMYSQMQPAKMRPRRKARKYLYAIGSVSKHFISARRHDLSFILVTENLPRNLGNLI